MKQRISVCLFGWKHIWSVILEGCEGERTIPVYPIRSHKHVFFTRQAIGASWPLIASMNAPKSFGSFLPPNWESAQCAVKTAREMGRRVSFVMFKS